MLSELGGMAGDDLEKELGLLLRGNRRRGADDVERALNLYRSGSAPPTVDGSLTAIGGMVRATANTAGGSSAIRGPCDDEFRSDPAYQSYYYSNVNLNPRLPPPLLTREELRYTQRMNGGSSVRWDSDGLIGFSGQKSLADIFQDDFGHGPVSRNTLNENADMTGSDETELAQLRELASGHSHKVRTYASGLGGSLSRSTTPDPQLVARVPSPCPTPIGAGRASAADKRGVNHSGSFNASSDIVSALSGMNLSGNGMIDGDNNTNGRYPNHEFQKSVPFMGNPYTKGSPTSTLYSNGGSPHQFHHLDAQNSSYYNTNLGGYSLNPPLASMMTTGQLGSANLAAISALELQGCNSRVLDGNMGNRSANQIAGNTPFIDPRYLQLASMNDPSMNRNFIDNNYMNNLSDLQKAYIGQLLNPLKSQYVNTNQRSYHGISYPGSPLRQHDMMNMMAYPSRPKNLNGSGYMPAWNSDAGFRLSLLDEFKSNKAKCFELLEIKGHVVEFSSDQYGSRFIQQKLETATMEEKVMVYEEIKPHALELMTDVFGNYVIQKFFEHGLSSQRRELAEKLFTNVLTLSLQMYGCRVIQKAIEVVDIDQKIEMVKELDGNVMRCVRDQNGNHVIQKCIECVPEHNIPFIISTFFDHIVALSTHPYGCRVVQRVLEHCKEERTQNKVMDEILSSVSALAQDQYGNYVVQHVLEYGKTDERSIIIKELGGKIVQMSQQKFASNVVEKCLIFGDPSERLHLVREILGSTDENEPLQAMMKDQFGNYVVQKVLETCDDQMRELLLSRIKVHLTALKKYTYGKHIVARVEKLVAAGERRMAVQINPQVA